MKRYLVNSISDDTNRFILIDENGKWQASREIKHEDGKWQMAWFSDEYPNQYGARHAIKHTFGK